MNLKCQNTIKNRLILSHDLCINYKGIKIQYKTSFEFLRRQKIIGTTQHNYFIPIVKCFSQIEHL